MGMALLSVESPLEHQCLVDLNNGFRLKSIHCPNKLSIFSADMKWMSKSHWTSGSDRACPFNFKWCTSNTFFYNNSINWLSGQPNNAFNQQECVQMMLNTGTGVATTYDDQPCSFLSYYICEVRPYTKNNFVATRKIQIIFGLFHETYGCFIGFGC
jgi:hypothetical protein